MADEATSNSIAENRWGRRTAVAQPLQRRTPLATQFEVLITSSTNVDSTKCSLMLLLWLMFDQNYPCRDQFLRNRLRKPRVTLQLCHHHNSRHQFQFCSICSISMETTESFLYQGEELTCIVTSPGTSQLKSNGKREKLTPIQRNSTYRKRRKEEAAFLQRQVVELSRRLLQLKERKSQVEDNNERTDEVLLGALKAIALRQCDKRLESEYQQELLLSAITCQKAVIQDLGQALRRKLRCEIKFDTVPSLDVENSMFYDAYLSSLSVLYGKHEEISSFVGLNPTFGKVFGGEPTKRMDGETEYFEKKWVGTVPFTFQATCDAVWKLAAAPHRQQDRSVWRDTGNSIAFQYSIPFQGFGTMRTYQVAQRYVESSRTVVVWRCLSDAREFFPGVSLDETGWCIIHAPKEGMEMETLVQSCIRLIPMQFGVTTEEMMREFIKLSITAGVDDDLEIEHMMESLILDDALKNDEFEFEFEELF